MDNIDPPVLTGVHNHSLSCTTGSENNSEEDEQEQGREDLDWGGWGQNLFCVPNGALQRESTMSFKSSEMLSEVKLD